MYPVGQRMGLRMKITKERTLGLKNRIGADRTNVGRFLLDRTRVRMDIA